MNIITQHIPGEIVTTSIAYRLGIYDWIHAHPVLITGTILIVGIIIILKALTYEKDREYKSYVNKRLGK